MHEKYLLLNLRVKVMNPKAGPKKNVPYEAEYHEFMSADSLQPPTHLTQQILQNVHQDFNPSLFHVFTKMGFIHLAMGTLTLVACPQFGIKFNFLAGEGLMAVFMTWGPVACTLACGAFFLGGSLLLTGLISRPEEVRVLRQSRYSLVTLLAGLSWLLFAMLGEAAPLSEAILWILGAYVAGIVAGEIGAKLRYWMLHLS